MSCDATLHSGPRLPANPRALPFQLAGELARPARFAGLTIAPLEEPRRCLPRFGCVRLYYGKVIFYTFCFSKGKPFTNLSAPLQYPAHCGFCYAKQSGNA